MLIIVCLDRVSLIIIESFWGETMPTKLGPIGLELGLFWTKLKGHLITHKRARRWYYLNKISQTMSGSGTARPGDGTAQTQSSRLDDGPPNINVRLGDSTAQCQTDRQRYH